MDNFNVYKVEVEISMILKLTTLDSIKEENKNFLFIVNL